MAAMKKGADALKVIHGGTTPDKVADTMDSIHAEREVANEISTAIAANPYADPTEDVRSSPALSFVLIIERFIRRNYSKSSMRSRKMCSMNVWQVQIMFPCMYHLAQSKPQKVSSHIYRLHKLLPRVFTSFIKLRRRLQWKTTRKLNYENYKPN